MVDIIISIVWSSLYSSKILLLMAWGTAGVMGLEAKRTGRTIIVSHTCSKMHSVVYLKIYALYICYTAFLNIFRNIGIQ